MPVLTDDERRTLEAAPDGARSGTGRQVRRGAAHGRSRGLAVAERGQVVGRAAPRPLVATGIWARLSGSLRDAGRPKPAGMFLNGAVVRARQKAVGAKG